MNTEDEWFSINEKETLPEIQRFVPSQIELIDLKLVDLLNDFNEEKIITAERIEKIEKHIKLIEKKLEKLENTEHTTSSWFL